VGKWHLGFLPHFGPLKSGYDRFFGIMSGGVDYFTHKDRVPGEGGADGLLEGEVPIERHGYLTELLGERAVQVVDGYAREGRPFLLSLHFTAPHWPWEGPNDEAESRRLRSLYHWDGGSQKTYAIMVRSMDDAIGRVLRTLDERGLAGNTIVVFTSDNGGERFSDVWPFSGKKGELLEGGLRVPMIARWPARLPAGATSGQVMASMDWMPTLLAAAGTGPAPDFPPDGEDLLPVLAGDAPAKPRKLFWRYKAHGQRALRDGDSKYLRIAGNEFLFDLAEDPRERANLKGRQRDVFERLKADWEAWNRGMLPELPSAYSDSADGSLLADRYGVGRDAGRD
jgi:arylsulfatase A-like enzyme